MDDLRTRIESALSEIRPLLKADGGGVELVDITPKMTVKVRLKGACKGCPFSFITMSSVIRERIIKAAPEVREVEEV